MHISEGVLSAPVLISGIALAASGTAIGLKKLDYDRIPQAAVLASAFFVASLIHVPVGVSSVHLILNGVAGLLLGWAVFPVILVSLFLQAILFQFGGVTTLGVNTIIMATPGVICHYLFARKIYHKGVSSAFYAFLCGALAIFLSGVLAALSLWLSDEQFLETAIAILAAHIPVMIVEGIITASCISFLKKVDSNLLPEFS